MTSTIYLVQAEGTSNFKIGITNQKLEERIAQLQTGNSDPLSLRSSFKTSYGTKLETQLHRHFGAKRKEGEWFQFESDDVVKFNEACAKYEKNYDALKDNPFIAKMFK